MTSLYELSGLKLTWFLAWGSKLSWFLCAGQKLLVFRVGIDWLSYLCGWSKSTCCLCASRKSLGFSVSIEIDLVSVWVEIKLIFLSGIELDLIRTELIWLSCGWWKLTWFQSGGSELTLIQYRDRNSVEIGIDLVFYVAVEMACFYCLDRN